MKSSREQVVRAQRGDRRACDDLIQRHYATVRRVVQRFASTPEDTDDLVQQVMISAFRSLRSLRDPDRLAPWLARIARNAGKMWVRARAAQPQLFSLDELPRGAGPTGDDPAADRLRETVANAVSALHPAHRQVCRLHYEYGFDYTETAALLNIPVAAVRGRLHRARGALRKELHVMASGADCGLDLGEDALRALRAAAGFASEERDAPASVLNAIQISRQGRVAATDSRRLFHHASPALAGLAPVVIHADLGRQLRDEHPGATRGHLTIRAGEAVLRLARDGAIRAPVLDSPFPQWPKVVPKSWELRVRAAAADWLAALDLLARQWPGGDVRPADATAISRVIITLSPAERCVSICRTLVDAAPTRITLHGGASFPARFLGRKERLVIAANAEYVEQAVRTVADGVQAEVELAANAAEEGPFLIRRDARSRTFVLTMPMKRPSGHAPIAQARGAAV